MEEAATGTVAPMRGLEEINEIEVETLDDAYAGHMAAAAAAAAAARDWDDSTVWVAFEHVATSPISFVSSGDYYQYLPGHHEGRRQQLVESIVASGFADEGKARRYYSYRLAEDVLRAAKSAEKLKAACRVGGRVSDRVGGSVRVVDGTVGEHVGGDKDGGDAGENKHKEGEYKEGEDAGVEGEEGEDKESEASEAREAMCVELRGRLARAPPIMRTFRMATRPSAANDTITLFMERRRSWPHHTHMRMYEEEERDTDHFFGRTHEVFVRRALAHVPGTEARHRIMEEAFSRSICEAFGHLDEFHEFARAYSKATGIDATCDEDGRFRHDGQDQAPKRFLRILKQSQAGVAGLDKSKSSANMGRLYHELINKRCWSGVEEYPNDHTVNFLLDVKLTGPAPSLAAAIPPEFLAGMSGF